MIIHYRGFEIEPVSDQMETGNWEVCPASEATNFMVYPEDIDGPTLETVETLAQAFAAVDKEFAQ